MPALRHRAYEAFAQSVASGLSLAKSYALASFAGDHANARRLRWRPHVAARIAEIREQNARLLHVHLETQTLKHEQVFEAAMDTGDWSAANAALIAIDRLHGLIVDRQRHEHDFLSALPPEVLRTLQEALRMVSERRTRRVAAVAPTSATEIGTDALALTTVERDHGDGDA